MDRLLLISVLAVIIITVSSGQGNIQPKGYQDLSRKDYKTLQYKNAQLAGRQYLSVTQNIIAGSVRSAKKEVLSDKVNYAISYNYVQINYCWNQVIIICNLQALCIGSSFLSFCS